MTQELKSITDEYNSTKNKWDAKQEELKKLQNEFDTKKENLGQCLSNLEREKDDKSKAVARLSEAEHLKSQGKYVWDGEKNNGPPLSCKFDLSIIVLGKVIK